MRNALGIAAGYAVAAATGLFVLVVAVNAIADTPPPHDALWIVLVVAFLAGAVGAVASVRYELASDTPKERVSRHLRMQTVSMVAIVLGVALLIAWAFLPPLIRVAAAAAYSGFVFGFLVVFIPNRAKAMAIRKFGPDD